MYLSMIMMYVLKPQTVTFYISKQYKVLPANVPDQPDPDGGAEGVEDGLEEAQVQAAQILLVRDCHTRQQAKQVANN